MSKQKFIAFVGPYSTRLHPDCLLMRFARIAVPTVVLTGWLTMLVIVPLAAHFGWVLPTPGTWFGQR